MIEFLKNKFKERPIVFLAWTGVVFLAIITYYRVSSIPSVQVQYNELLKEKQLVEYNVLNGAGIDEDLEKIRSLTKMVSTHFMDPAEKASNFHYFFSLEELTGVKISNPRLGSIQAFGRSKNKVKDPNEPNLAVTEYTLSVEGTFQQLLKLIYELETGPLLARITKCIIDVGKNVTPGALSGVLEVSFLGKPD